MGIHASYYQILSARLEEFKTNLHSEGFLLHIDRFRKETPSAYIPGTWHILDFIINPPGNLIPELRYAVLGHEFPAPDGSVKVEPHLRSYSDEYWQLFSYVTAEEVSVIAQYLQLVVEDDPAIIPGKMKHIYRRPLSGKVSKREYLDQLTRLKNFYQKAAENAMAALISIG